MPENITSTASTTTSVSPSAFATERTPLDHAKLAGFLAAEIRGLTPRMEDAVRAAVAGGMSYREVARHVGMAHNAVARIVARGKR